MPNKQLLSDCDPDVLEFERQHWKYAAAKETTVREKFDVSAVHYYQLLEQLLDRPEAMEADPSTVRRLIRLREKPRGARRGASGRSELLPSNSQSVPAR